MGPGQGTAIASACRRRVLIKIRFAILAVLEAAAMVRDRLCSCFTANRTCLSQVPKRLFESGCRTLSQTARASAKRENRLPGRRPVAPELPRTHIDPKTPFVSPYTFAKLSKLQVFDAHRKRPLKGDVPPRKAARFMTSLSASYVQHFPRPSVVMRGEFPWVMTAYPAP